MTDAVHSDDHLAVVPPGPTRVVLKCEAIDLDSVQLFSEPQDAAVSIKLGADRIEALVPLHVVNKEQSTVVAMIVNHGDITVLSFAPTNFGVERYDVDMDKLSEIIVPDSAVTGG